MKADEAKTLIREAAADRSTGIPGGAFQQDPSIEMIAGGGSERLFFRVAEGSRSVVFLLQEPGAEELRLYVETGDFLRPLGIPVPEFFHYMPERGLLVMEDLGEVHLDEELGRSNAEEELAFYRDATDMLFRLQTAATGKMLETGFLEGRVFEAEELLGETDYFAEEFVKGMAGMDLPEGWEGERRRLADSLAVGRRVFMHRDLQSRNIMVKGGRLRLMDFQSAHRGPELYDIASLLKDPYHVLAPGTRKTLLMELFYRLSEVPGDRETDYQSFERLFVLAGIQRNMQALAAFAFLGRKMGKARFLDSIPPALDLLEEGLVESGDFPAILSLTHGLRSRLDI